jgi:hypothetical protein
LPGARGIPASKACASLGAQAAVLRIKLVGANQKPALEGLEPQPGRANYFIGNDPANWRRNLPTYARVAYRDVYPGIDQIYYGGSQDRLEYDFVVAPGADPTAIRLRFDGAGRLTLERNGDLALALGEAKVIQHAPLIYQVRDGRRERVAGRALLKHHNTLSFEVSSYDRRRPLTIDPGLLYSTLVGGNGSDGADAIALDGAGDAYVTGFTQSTNFPVTAGVAQPALGAGAGQNAFVTKLKADGSGLIYSTYLGGGNVDEGFGVAVDGAGSAYVAGLTASTNFPVTSGAFQKTFHAGALANAFVTKLKPDGSDLIYSSYLGGSFDDFGEAITVDGAGDAYVTGGAF